MMLDATQHQAGRPPLHQRGRVLVVDDEPMASLRARKLLRDAGYEAQTADCGLAALGMIEAYAPTVVITDLRMPYMDGVELTRQIQVHHPQIPVIVASAFGEVAAVVAAMRVGAADYLLKPLVADDLLPAIERVHQYGSRHPGHDQQDPTASADDRRRDQEKLAMLGTLATGLAHEIRNPLNGAQLHLTYLQSLLEDVGAGTEVLDTVNIVRTEISRLGRLVTEFLGFARPQPLALKSVPVQGLLERAVKLIGPIAAIRGTAIALDTTPDGLAVFADGAKLEQVVLNIVQNAVDALSGGAGDGHVVLRARTEAQHAVIEVQDDGPGIPSDAPIFDPFFTTKPEGTGLGLSISRGIINEHGGTLTVASRPGDTMFCITLPLDGPPEWHGQR